MAFGQHLLFSEVEISLLEVHLYFQKADILRFVSESL